ncbi:MAG: GerMN domain-containing protein [Acidimicrobiia bacterium]|nr:GerMN domain-containing protein [Acidimicrobiia bacterium]
MKRITILISAIALLVAACGAGDGVVDAGPVTTATGDGLTTTTQAPSDSTAPPTTADPSTSTTTTTAAPTPTRFVDVYFVKDAEYAVPVATAVPDTPQVATNAIRALIAGPTPDQEAAGLFSAVPSDTLLLGITIDNGLARLDLSREFEAGGGSFSMLARLAQVVYTLTQFSTIDAVELWLDGAPVTVFSGEGLLLEGPMLPSDYFSALPLAPTGTAERWDQDDIGDLSAYGSQIRRVVLVTEDDVLNVRADAGVQNDIIGMLAPGTVIGLSGSSTTVGSSTWVEIVTPAGDGWVNAHFLSEVVSDEAFAADDRVLALLNEMANIVYAEGDLSQVASRRGFYIWHHDGPVRFSASELVDVMTDPTTYKWGSNALDVTDPDQASEIPSRTFAEAIGTSFASTWDDPDREFKYDEPFEGGNGRPAAWAIPYRLSGFHYVSIYDSGDNPDFAGLDWTIWHVSIDYEDGEPVVVGLTIDQWAP